MLKRAGAISGAALLGLVCLARLINCTASAQWQRLETASCLAETLAVQGASARADIECVVYGSQLSGLLVAQFDSDTRQCSLFQYIAVCHLIDALASNGISTPKRCIAFANARAVNFMTLSRKLMSSVGSKLRAAWVMSDDEEASKSNLVCGQTLLWKSESVEFISEGAKFNGVSSKMKLEAVNFGNQGQALTWLIRYKRVPKECPLLENANCITATVGSGLWDGIIGIRGLYFSGFAPTTAEFTTSVSTNTFNSSAFVEVGVTTSAPINVTFFSNAAFVPPSLVTKSNIYSPVPQNFSCFTIGYRHGDSRMFQGTIRSVAIMNDTMTENEIRNFFSLVR